MFKIKKAKNGRAMLYRMVDGRARLVSRAEFVAGATAAQIRQLEAIEASAGQLQLEPKPKKKQAKPTKKQTSAAKKAVNKVATQAREVADRARADATEAGREARKARTTARKAEATAAAAEKASKMPLYGWS